MKVNVWKTIQQLSRERGVDTSIIVKAIEESLKVASHKYFSNNEEVVVSFKPERGELRVYSVKQITQNANDTVNEISLEEAKKIDAASAIGNYLEVDLPSDTLGRIAAQAAKQVIFQKVRTAEQEKIYSLFAAKQGEIITGILRRWEPNKNMVLEVNKTEALLPEKEKLKDDNFKRGDRIKAVITHVLKDSAGPQIIVSRVHTSFLARLLELETPEIANGNIAVKHIVRQPGERAKVAVITKEKDIDPIGACIGVRGNRILAISKELCGEKIDVIEWSEDPLTFAKSALSPAKVEDILISDERQKILEARVPKDQLSLAIGKKGINVRLASRLVGWKIDIKK